MKQIFLLLTFLSTFKVGSSQEKFVYEFQQVKTIRLPFEDAGMPYFTGNMSQYLFINEKETMILATPTDKLVFYDLGTQDIYHEIQLPNRMAIDFEYISSDSIFIAFMGNPSLVRMNDRGFILQSYDFDKVKDKSNYPSFLGNTLEIKNGYCVVELNGTASAIGSKKFMRSYQHIVGLIDLKRQQIIPSKSLHYPKINPGNYLPNDLPIVHHCIGRSGLPIVRFYYSSDVYEWQHIKDDSYNTYSLKSMLIDSVGFLPKSTYYSEYSLPYHYNDVMYDPYRKLYFSSLYFNSNFYEGNVWSMIIADENLNFLSEVYLPPINSYPHFSEDYIITNTGSGCGYVDINYFRLEKTETPLTPYIEIAKTDLANRKGKVSVPLDKACE